MALMAVTMLLVAYAIIKVVHNRVLNVDYKRKRGRVKQRRLYCEELSLKVNKIPDQKSTLHSLDIQCTQLVYIRGIITSPHQLPYLGKAEKDNIISQCSLNKRKF